MGENSTVTCRGILEWPSEFRSIARLDRYSSIIKPVRRKRGLVQAKKVNEPLEQLRRILRYG
jgi:hypothetical protein